MNGTVICSNSPLAFYSSPAEQNHRKDYAFGNVSPILTPLGVLPPFQFVVPESKDEPEYDCNASFENYKLIRLSDGKEFPLYGIPTVRGHMNGDGTLTVSCNGGNLEYKQTGPVPGEGLYYLYFEFNAFDQEGNDLESKYAYSEVFCMSSHTEDWLKLTYSSSTPFTLSRGQVRFDNGFRFTVYLDTQVGRPKYPFEEEVSERMGYSFIESQVSKKTFGFTALAPEYLCDALRLVRLCDKRSITSRGRSYSPVSFDMDVSWEDQGDLASLQCSFDTDTVVCGVGGYVPESALRRMGFTNDFNLDFD